MFRRYYYTEWYPSPWEPTELVPLSSGGNGENIKKSFSQICHSVMILDVCLGLFEFTQLFYECIKSFSINAQTITRQMAIYISTDDFGYVCTKSH